MRDEADLLDIGLYGTVRHVEKSTRLHRRAQARPLRRPFEPRLRMR